MFIHVGTYDGAIATFEGQPGDIKQRFMFKASDNSIRSLHRSGKYLIAGGYDEMIHVYDIVRGKEDGEVDAEQGPISQLTSDGKILITAGGQGSIKMWTMGKFNFLHQLKEHKAQISHLTVDVSGKVMFSVGLDRKLVMWNLPKALRIFDKKLDFQAFRVLLTTERDKLILAGQHQITIMETEQTKQIATIKCQQKIQDVVLYQDRFVLAGSEQGFVYAWLIDNPINHLKFKAHEERTKCIGIACVDEQQILVTACSNGQVRIWDVLVLLSEMESMNQDYVLDELQPMQSFETKQRIICLEVGANRSKTDQKQQNNQVEAEQVREEEDENRPKRKKKIRKIPAELQKTKQKEKQKVKQKTKKSSQS